MRSSKNISSFQFITNNPIHAELACKGGCKWVQLRVKDTSIDEYLHLAKVTKLICDKHEASLIINDHIDIAKEVNAAGVHLGKNDPPVSEARTILGDNFIIGGTANTLEDILALKNQQVDYIGLGPFRFTTTKANLSPVIGENGYANIVKECHQLGIQLPLIAIGGIDINDVNALISLGLYGIAVSSAIANDGDISFKTNEFINKISASQI
jgi:thiamine-phosphate pyrophosphorylase